MEGGGSCFHEPLPGATLCRDPDATLPDLGATLCRGPDSTLADPDPDPDPDATLPDPEATPADPEATLADPEATLADPEPQWDHNGSHPLIKNDFHNRKRDASDQTDFFEGDPKTSPLLEENLPSLSLPLTRHGQRSADGKNGDDSDTGTIRTTVGRPIHLGEDSPNKTRATTTIDPTGRDR